jgi:hypothetical protein
MCADGGTGTAQMLKKTLRDAAETIRLAGECLAKASEAALGYDAEMVDRIRVERASLDAFLAPLTEAQSIREDVLLREAACVLKPQAASLRASSDRIKEMASGTKPTPGVVGYLDEAVTLIAQSLAFMAELP